MVEHDGKEQLCYDGEAFRRVMALPATPIQQSHAALALTRPECADDRLSLKDRYNLDIWRAAILDRVSDATLPEYGRNRLRIRKAEIWAGLTYQQARRNESAQVAAVKSQQLLAAVHKAQLTEKEIAHYTEAAIGAGANRWAINNTHPTAATIEMIFTAGQTGETCITVTEPNGNQKAQKVTLIRRCTFSQVWPGSVNVNPQGHAVVLAVQPMAGWSELWVFHRAGASWTVDVLPPSENGPGVGYAEFAGWVPGGRQMLVVREAKSGTKCLRKFQVVNIDTLAVQKQADRPEGSSLFNRWKTPAWLQHTISLR